MSIILAKIFGLYFLGAGLAFLLNPKRIAKIYQQIMENEAILFLGGILALLFGAFIVSVHNVWVMGWPVIITILGWMSLVKGVALLSYPRFAQFFSFILLRPNSFYSGMGILLTLFGLFFCYLGWG